MTTTPYMIWKSPIGADLITDNSLTSLPQAIGIAECRRSYHRSSVSLGKPSSEKGSNAIVRTEDDTDAFDLSGMPKTEVREYGGAVSAYIAERCTSQTSKLVIFIEI